MFLVFFCDSRIYSKHFGILLLIIEQNFIFFIGSAMNYKANPGIDLEFQPFLAEWQKKTFSMFFCFK